MSPAPMLSVASGVRKNTRRIAASSSADEPPRTPLRRASTGYASSSRLSSLPKTPVPRGANKRTRSAAFPNASSQPPLGEESDNSDKDFNNSNRFATPQRNKRQRLTTPPPAPGRAPKTLVVVESDDDNDMDMDWTDDDDRHLVEMVVRKLQLTQSDWEECAMRLGKGDSRSLGKRWEGLLGSIALKNHRRKRIGGPRISRN